MALHFCNHDNVRSTTQRRAGSRFLPRRSFFSSPIRRICGTYPASSAASSPEGLSYPLSRHRFWSTSSGSGRSTTIASMVASSNWESWTLAPSITAARGPPSASTRMLFFTPGFPLSVGFRPIFFPAESSFVHAGIGRLPLPVNTIEFSAFLHPRCGQIHRFYTRPGTSGGCDCHHQILWATCSIGNPNADEK